MKLLKKLLSPFTSKRRLTTEVPKVTTRTDLEYLIDGVYLNPETRYVFLDTSGKLNTDYIHAVITRFIRRAVVKHIEEMGKEGDLDRTDFPRKFFTWEETLKLIKTTKKGGSATYTFSPTVEYPEGRHCVVIMAGDLVVNPISKWSEIDRMNFHDVVFNSLVVDNPNPEDRMVVADGYSHLTVVRVNNR